MKKLTTYMRTLRAGFTLTEMLTVVLIVGILTSLAMPQYKRFVQRARVTEAVTVLRMLADSAERLATSFGARTVAGFASGNTSKFVFSRFDMVGNSTISCPFTNTVLTCEYFTYTLNANGTITARQTDTGVELTVDPDEPTSSDNYITCVEGVAGGSLCDLYGYASHDPAGE